MNILDQTPKIIKSIPNPGIFKALAHPARLAILEVLRDGEACVCHMEAHLGYRQSYLSQQLAVLREAGIISDRREGWNIYYQVVNPNIFKVLDSAALLSCESVAKKHQSSLSCPCPKCNPNK